MVINGEEYTKDLIIYSDRIKGNWRRKKGHLLQKEDLEEIIEKDPDVLIVGTGAYGLMKIPEDTVKFIESNDIKLIDNKSKKAVDEYNKYKGKKEKTVAAFHLTC